MKPRNQSPRVAGAGDKGSKAIVVKGGATPSVAALHELYGYRVTHRLQRLKPFDRFHWELKTEFGFSFRGNNENGMGWPTQEAAVKAGTKTMLAYFKRLAVQHGVALPDERP